MPTSAFLSLMPQVHPADKKAEVRTISGLATARVELGVQFLD